MYSKSTNDLPPFYVEYEHSPESINKERPDYRIHISFPTAEEASALFATMDQQWHLPVILKGNRVVIDARKTSENQDRGAQSNPFLPGNSVGVFFANELDAKQFYDYLSSAQGLYDGNKMSRITLDTMFRNMVLFWRLDHPRFSLEHRISAYNQLVRDCNFKPSLLHHDFSVEANQKAIDQLVYLCFLLKSSENLPNDIILLILQAANTLRFKETSNSLYEISQRFQLPNEQLPVPYQKIACNFKWTVGLPTSGQLYAYNMYLHFICETPNEAMILSRNLQKARADTIVTMAPGYLDPNTITMVKQDRFLEPGKFPWIEGEDFCFGYDSEGEIVCSLINFKDQGVKCDKARVRFSVNSLLENKEFVAAVHPPTVFPPKQVANPHGFFEDKPRETIKTEAASQAEASSDWGCCGFDMLCAFVNWLVSLLSSCCCEVEVEEEEGLRFN